MPPPDLPRNAPAPLPPGPPHATAWPRCSICQAPLGALRARLRTVCEQPACLQRHDAHLLRKRLADLTDQVQAQLGDALGRPAGVRTPVVWIEAHQAQPALEPDAETEALREAHLRYLSDLAADPATQAATPAEPAPQAAPPQVAESRLCGWCGGRCCQFGGESQAYLEPAHLRRWQQQHPGSSLADAAAAYAERLPRHVVRGSCLYHGAQGCTLDRDMRSDVCNRFACDGLRDLQLGQARGDGPPWLFGQVEHQHAQALAHVAATGELQPLPLPGADTP